MTPARTPRKGVFKRLHNQVLTTQCLRQLLDDLFHVDGFGAFVELIATVEVDVLPSDEF